MTFSGAASAEHAAVNRANIGVIRGSLSPQFHDWRPPQVADFVRMAGTVRYGPSQSEEGVLADIERLLAEIEDETPRTCCTGPACRASSAVRAGATTPCRTSASTSPTTST